MIDKRISKSDKLASLSMDRSRVLYFLIYPHLDCEGRYSADPRDIKEDCCPRLPYTVSQVADSLIDLHNVGLIRLYEADNKAYLEASRFEEFQPGLRKDREAESEIPPYSGSLRTNSGVLRSWSALSLRLSLSLSSIPPKSPHPAKSKAPKKTKPKISLDLSTWQWENIADADLALWAEAYPAVDIRLALRQMIVWCKEHQSDGKGRKSNWAAFIARWLKREQDKGGNVSVGRSSPKGPDPYVGQSVPSSASDKALEARLKAEYQEVTKKFMAARGYASEDDIPFDEFETFSMFKARRIREMKQEGRHADQRA